MSELQFQKNSCTGFYLSVAIRKTAYAVETIRSSVESILEGDWIIAEKGIWVSVGEEERIFEDLEDAFKTLAEAKRGALAIILTAPKTQDKVFIRWYNSAPQTDVLTVDGSLALERGIVHDSTPLETTRKIADSLLKELSIRPERLETKPLSPEYLESQAIPVLAELQLKSIDRRHFLAQRPKRTG